MSEWKEDAAKRRDFRHQHNGPDVPRPKRRKNTKRWCKGIVGREHKIEHVRHPASWMKDIHIDRCAGCGKVIKDYWPNNWMTWPRRDRKVVDGCCGRVVE